MAEEANDIPTPRSAWSIEDTQKHKGWIMSSQQRDKKSTEATNWEKNRNEDLLPRLEGFDTKKTAASRSGGQTKGGQNNKKKSERKKEGAKE